jgi:ubiquinone/menaquinone biosynthesis C-methylase UbiE
MVYTEEDSLKRRDFFNAFADYICDSYGSVFQLFKISDENQLVDFYLQDLKIEEGDKILDVGCGTGIIDIKLANFYSKIEMHGIDISDSFLDKGFNLISASGTQEKVFLKQGDFHYLSSYYPEQYFDKIFLLESFSYASNKRLLLNEIKKVLKPNGQVYIKDVFLSNIGNKSKQIEETYNFFIDDLKNFSLLFPNKIQETLDMFLSDNFVLNEITEPKLFFTDKEVSKKRLDLFYKFGLNIYNYSDLFKYKIEYKNINRFLFLEQFIIKLSNSSIKDSQL